MEIMKKSLVLLCTFVTTLLLMTGCGDKDAVDNSGTISGFVTDYTNANAPISGATVTLNPNGVSKTTGSDGRYLFSDVEPGTYTLQVSANNFQPTTKQVSVGVNQNVSCDFQLSAGAVDVVVSPVTLNFGASAEQLSFVISNNSTGSLNYNISNVPSFAQVSPTTGSVAARGKQSITVSIINRASITTSRNGQLTVNVGSDSYTVSISVDPYQQETVNVDINPQTLSFDKDTEQLKFTMVSNYSKALEYTINNNLDILTVSPENGTLAARGRAEISVSVKDRKNVTAERKGSLTIIIGGNSYVVNVSVAKYEEDVTPPDPISTNRGLVAFYSFDDNNADDMSGNRYHGALSGGSFITDTPNGKGKALSLRAKDYVSIGYNPLSDKTAQTVSMWIKDFNVGTLLKLQNDQNVYSPTFLISENMKLSCYYNYSKSSIYEANTTLTSYQEGKWTMVTLVVSKTGLNGSSLAGTLTFYVNGRRIDSIEKYVSSKGTSMTIGGLIMYGSQELYWNSAMKVDNVRIHGVALSDDEIEAIYNAEKSN
jgi:hypothetical protein